jgi:DNA-directed RNA polymerase specialized sigma24 family protein
LIPVGREAGFDDFVTTAEPRLRRASVAAFGPERGVEATAEALAYAWEHWPEIQTFDNPIGYLYRVGRSRTRVRKVRRLFERPANPDQWTEPGLGKALQQLSEPERVAVVVTYCSDMSRTDAASLLQISEAALQKRAERGLARLRRSLGVQPDE